MQHLNQVVIAGNIGREPEIGATIKGVLVAKFSVAVNAPSRRRSPAKTVWFPCLATDEQAEMVSKNLGRGDAVYVEGALETYETTRRGTGVKTKAFRIRVERIRPAQPRGKPAEWESVSAVPQSQASGFEEMSFDFAAAR